MWSEEQYSGVSGTVTLLPAPHVSVAMRALPSSIPDIHSIDACSPITNPTHLFASHAAHNPLQPIIPPSRKQGKTYDKQSAKVARTIRQEKQEEFLKDLASYKETQLKAVQEMAVKYHRKPEYIGRLVNSQTLYKKHRSTNLYNAKVAWKGKQMNEGRALGNRFHLQEIQAAVRDDLELQSLTKEQEAELLRMLEEEKAVKRTGARINNRAATLDYQSTVHRIEQEMTALRSRTGITGFAFFSRSHINDSMQPEWVSTPGTLSFLPETLQTTAGEVGRKFELWSCTKGDKRVKNELVRLQSERSKTIVQKLREILNRRDVTMSYRYYDIDIQLQWKVQLRGWPEEV